MNQSRVRSPGEILVWNITMPRHAAQEMSRQAH